MRKMLVLSVSLALAACGAPSDDDASGETDPPDTDTVTDTDAASVETDAPDSDSDLDDTQPPNPFSASLSTITGEEGAAFTVPNAGQSSARTGVVVLGWDSGALLDGAFFRLLRISASPTLNLRFNLPQGADADAVIYSGDHDLYPFLVNLQDTQDLGDTLVELYTTSGEPLGHASGTVRLRQDVSVNGTVYDLIGEVEATFTSGASSWLYTGLFWDQDLSD